jgi:GTPase SAR1 family protein
MMDVGADDVKFTAKIVLLGDAGVGKSSIVLRLVNGTFDKYNEPTVAWVKSRFRYKFDLWCFYFPTGSLQGKFCGGSHRCWRMLNDVAVVGHVSAIVCRTCNTAVTVNRRVQAPRLLVHDLAERARSTIVALLRSTTVNLLERL